MPDYRIEWDENGDVRVTGEAPGLLALYLEDINVDLAACERDFRAIAEVRAGRRPSVLTGCDVTRVTISPTGALIRIAARLTRNPEVPVSLDELEEGLRRLRAALADRPPA